MVIGAIRSGLSSCWNSSRATKFWAVTTVALGALFYHRATETPEEKTKAKDDLRGLEPDKLDVILEKLARIEANMNLAASSVPSEEPEEPGELLSPEQIARTYCTGGDDGAAAFRRELAQHSHELVNICLPQAKEINLAPILEAAHPFFFLSYLRDRIGVDRSEHFRIWHEECLPVLVTCFTDEIKAEELVISFGRLIERLLNDWRDKSAQSSWFQDLVGIVMKLAPKWAAKPAIKKFVTSELLQGRLKKDYQGYIAAAKKREGSLRSKLEGKTNQTAENIMGWFNKNHQGLLDLDDEGAYCMLAHHYFDTDGFETAQKLQATLVDLFFQSKGHGILWGKRSLFLNKAKLLLQKPAAECKLGDLAPVVAKWLAVVKQTKVKTMLLSLNTVYEQREEIKDLPEFIQRLNVQVRSDLAVGGSSQQ